MAIKNNKGFSLVEVIVAVAVFAILIVPLTSQLITAIKTNTKSTKKQYAVEKAEELMESFKVCELADSVGDTITIADGNANAYKDDADYDATAHNYVFEKTNTDTQSVTLPNGEDAYYFVDTYTCNDISLGKEYAKYTATITVDSKAYAVSAGGYVWDEEKNDFKKTTGEDGTEQYVSTAAASGTVRNLDDAQSAIITGATYLGSNSSVSGNSLDNQAYQYFKDKKIDLLRNYSAFYNRYLAGNDYFIDDTFEKHTIISVSGNSASGYIIKCSVEYKDKTEVAVISAEYTSGNNNIYKPESVYGEEGVVYLKSFETLPPIYLLYQPATYNGNFCKNDYIDIDTSGLTDGDVAKVYLFESVADLDSKYAEVICEQFGVSDVDELVYKNPSINFSQSEVDVAVNQTAGDAGTLKTYSNFSNDAANSNITVKSTSEDESDDIYLYDITITLTDDDGNNTIVSGTRGKK